MSLSFQLELRSFIGPWRSWLVCPRAVDSGSGLPYSWVRPAPGFPGGGPACHREASATRSQVQDDHQVGTRAWAIIGPRGLSGLVGVLLCRPADEALRV